MKAVALTLALALTGGAMAPLAQAETFVQKVPPCPPVYGSWKTAYITDKYGNAEPVAPSPGWDGLIMEAHIGKDKAVLVWFGGKKKMTFKRQYKFRQWDGSFIGLNGKRELIAETDFEVVAEHPKDKCYLEVSYYLDTEGAGLRDQTVIMEKVQ